MDECEWWARRIPLEAGEGWCFSGFRRRNERYHGRKPVRLHISYLRTIESEMSKKGFLSSGEVFTLDSDENIYQFLLLMVDFVEKEGVIPPEEAMSFRNGITYSLPPLITEERERLCRGELPADADNFFKIQIANSK